MGRINWTEESLKWLKEIHDYIAIENPAAAHKTVNGIYEKTQILTSFPEIGHQYQTATERQIRILLYGHYRIAYLIKSNKDIDILGIFHGSLNIDRFFEGS